MINPRNNFWSLVLAGGDGTRLQALTRRICGEPMPKQYCRIFGEESLLEATLRRACRSTDRNQTMAIVNEDHLRWALPQVAALPLANVVVQPCNRETGPGLALALLELERRDPSAVVSVFPSDHFIGDEMAFDASLRHMRQAVTSEPDRIVLMGIEPEFPESGFGYILPARANAAQASLGTSPVLRFEEKPNLARARRIIQRGALWSSFVMMFRVGRMLELLRDSRSNDMAALEGLPIEAPVRDQAFAALTPWNFSKDFLAKRAEDLLVLRATGLGWDDLGTPEAVERTMVARGLVPPWRQEMRLAATA